MAVAAAVFVVISRNCRSRFPTLHSSVMQHAWRRQQALPRACVLTLQATGWPAAAAGQEAIIKADYQFIVDIGNGKRATIF